MKFALPGALLFAAFLVQPCAAEVRDVTLWQEARAGMSPQQVLAAFPDARPVTGEKKDSGSEELVRLSGYELSSDRFDVGFYFRDHRLESVELKLVGHSAGDALSVYDRLLAKLRAEHGKETASLDKEIAVMAQKRADWSVGDLAITLLYFNVGQGPANLKLVYYVQP